MLYQELCEIEGGIIIVGTGPPGMVFRIAVSLLEPHQSEKTLVHTVSINRASFFYPPKTCTAILNRDRKL